jgi:hypothetical protein
MISFAISSADRNKVEQARTYLALLGTRAVPAAISAPRGSDKQAAAIPALSVIRDQPHAADHWDAARREPKIREAACRARPVPRASRSRSRKIVKTELRAVRARGRAVLATIR